MIKYIPLLSLKAFTLIYSRGTSSGFKPKSSKWQKVQARFYQEPTMHVNQERMSRNQKILSEVSQMLSKCQVSESDNNVSQLLPFCADILSEMEQIVSVCQKMQKFSDTESDVDMWWDSSPDLTGLQSSLSVSTSSLSDVSFYSSESDNVGDLFVQSLAETIDRLAPNQIYSKARAVKKRMRRARKKVHPELRMIWQHVSQILSPAPRVQISKPQVPVVDWSKVNKRFLGNIPTPKLHPVHGCSPDPAHYLPYQAMENRFDGDVMVNCPPRFEEPLPFGSEWGLETDVGVIGLQNIVIHGHVWSPDKKDWVLHAEFLNTKQRERKRERKKEKETAV